MASNLCPDSDNIVCEIVKFATNIFYVKFVEMIDAMIDNGYSNDSSRTSLFYIFQKSRDMTSLENDQPIAIL